MRALVLLLLLIAGPAWAQAIPSTTNSVAITINGATTTRLVTGVSNKRVYVTAVDVIATGTGTIQFIAGTDATCGTGTVNITGAYSLTAQVGFTKGTGVGALWAVPLHLSLCAVTTGAVGFPGSLAYAIQ